MQTKCKGSMMSLARLSLGVILWIAAPDAVCRSQAVQDWAAFFPRQKYQALPGKAIGVLVSDADELMKREGRKGPAGVFCFSTGGASYRWVYVPVQGKALIGGLRVPLGEKGETRRRFDNLNMADSKSLKKWGITQPFTLVDIEVNGGLGSPAGETFVATNMQSVEGTKEYPFRVADVIGRLRQSYRSWLDQQQTAINTTLDEAQMHALKDRQPTGPREATELVFVTWLPETKQLRVHLQTRVSDGAYRDGRVLKLRPSAGSQRVARQEESVRFGTMFGVELGMAYEVSRTGELERSQVLPIRSFQEEIPAPRPPRRPGDHLFTPEP